MESEVNQNPEDSSSKASGEAESKQVSHATYLKAVETEKNLRKRAQEAETRLQELERRDMEAKGEFEKLKQSLLQENETLKKTLKQEKESYLWERVTSGIKTESLKAGCADPDKLIKLLDKNDFLSLQSEADGYTLKQESLKSLVEKAKKENFFLFPTQKVEINDATPKAKVEKPVKKAPSEMNQVEINEAFKNNLSALLK